MVRHPSTTSLLGKHLPWDLGTPWRQKPSAEGRGAAGWAGGTVPEPRMVGRALGGRDPVRELVLLLPLLLVPPPLHVSCREESWPGIEMDLAVDGGLGKTEVCDRGAPPSASEENRGAPPPQAACTHTHVLKQGSPESRNIPMVTYKTGRSQPHCVHSLSSGARLALASLLGLQTRLGL